MICSIQNGEFGPPITLPTTFKMMALSCDLQS